MPTKVKKGRKIQRWEKALDNPQKALKQVGIMMVAESQRAFVEQKFGGQPWRERAVPNVMGIIADFAAGRTKPKARRFDARPALMDTGALAKSISYRIISADTVEVGTNLPYAPTLHSGGKVQSETITEKVQDALAKWLKSQRNAIGRKTKDGRTKEQKADRVAVLEDKLGWLLDKAIRGKKLEMDVPKRRMVGVTKQTKKDIRQIVKVAIFEVD